MIRIKLSAEEREELEKARNIRTSNLAERSFFVLLSDEGKSVGEIARQTGRHEHTIRSWLKAYEEGGIEGIKGSFPPGRRNKKGQAIREIRVKVVEHSPVDYGYLEEGWTVNLLVDYVSKQGMEASSSTVKRALKKEGFVYKRFARTVSSNAPSQEKKTAGGGNYC